MIYLRDFTFPSEQDEIQFLFPKDMTADEIIADVFRDCRAKDYSGSVYPFKILDRVKLRKVEFDSITFFSGGNGCGKTTALNVIAEKLRLKRDNLFNCGRFFQDYLNLCSYFIFESSDNLARKFSNKDQGRGVSIPVDSRIIVSDDVFAHSMKQRKYNENIDLNRDAAEQDFMNLIGSGRNLRSLEDYDRWKARREALKSKSAFMKQHLGVEAEEHSNGETAMMYFLERMENAGLYLLDEPENSLSLENQIKLAEYIEASARFFNCQFIIATHSPIFLSIKGAAVYDFDEIPVKEKKWTELENVKTMYSFFKSHEDEFIV